MTSDFAATAIVFNQYGLGHADEALRLKLATNYLRTLVELGSTRGRYCSTLTGLGWSLKDHPA